jgi:hypothetical protein
MKTIQFEDIQKIYYDCGLDLNTTGTIRNTINVGTLDNRLNSNYKFLNKNSVGSIWSGSAINSPITLTEPRGYTNVIS